MEKLTILGVKPHTTKTGKQMYFLKTSRGDMSTFEDFSQWTEGMEVEGVVIPDREGKFNPTFKYPKQNDFLEERVKRLETAMGVVKRAIQILEGNPHDNIEIDNDSQQFKKDIENSGEDEEVNYQDIPW